MMLCVVIEVFESRGNKLYSPSLNSGDTMSSIQSRLSICIPLSAMQPRQFQVIPEEFLIAKHLLDRTRVQS